MAAVSGFSYLGWTPRNEDGFTAYAGVVVEGWFHYTMVGAAAASVSLTPTTGALTATGVQGTIQTPTTITPLVGSLTLTPVLVATERTHARPASSAPSR